MQLTRFSDYSLRMLIYVALREGERATIGEIAECYGISRNHLMKVANNLVTLGYLRGLRGKNGRLLLASEPDDINLGRLIRDVEPDMHLAECFNPKGHCVIAPACSLAGILDKALAAFLSVLDEYSLADVTSNPKELLRLLGPTPSGKTLKS